MQRNNQRRLQITWTGAGDAASHAACRADCIADPTEEEAEEDPYDEATRIMREMEQDPPADF